MSIKVMHMSTSMYNLSGFVGKIHQLHFLYLQKQHNSCFVQDGANLEIQRLSSLWMERDLSFQLFSDGNMGVVGQMEPD